MKKYKTILIWKKTFLAVLILITINVYAQPKNETSIDNSKTIPDYSNLYFWAAHPYKKDFSDSIPLPLINEPSDSLVDVFFIHPTTYTEKTFSNWNADIQDKVLNDKTDKSTILYQASVFNGSCRVFAPRYRQAHINSFYIDKNTAAPYFDLAYEDVKNAFVFYMEHYNNGRPIIIASHSQGTVHAGRLLKDFFVNKTLFNQLVCAYIIGMPVREDYFQSIPVCDGPNKTGCFVSWRTFRNGYNPEFVEKENFNSVVVNPLSWKIDDVYASKKMNKGGLLRNFNKIVPHVVDARIHKNILWACKPDVFGKIFFTHKNFHIGDINLYYMNIRENVKQRIASYFESNK